MKKIKAAALVLALLASTGLTAQMAADLLIEKAWELMFPDRAAADSITYLLLGSVNEEPGVNDSLLARILFLAGTLEHHKKRYHISCNFFEQALRTGFIRGNKKHRLHCLNNMGSSLNRLGKIPEALEAFQEAMRLSVELGDQTSILDLQVNIAELECDLGEYDKAISLASQALASYEEIKDTFSMGLCHLNLGKYFIYKKQHLEGEEHNRMAIRLFECLGAAYSLIPALVNQSRLEQVKNQFAASEQVLERILGIVKSEKLD